MKKSKIEQIFKPLWFLLGIAVTFFLHFSGLYERGRQNANKLRVRQVKIKIDNLPAAFEGYRLLVMSDFHIDGKNNITPVLCRMLPGLKAEACCLLGDYRWALSDNSEQTIKLMAKVLKQIQVRDGIFGILGNHDDEELMDNLGAIGVTVLRNQSVPIQQQGERLWFVGVDDPHSFHADDLCQALNKVPRHDIKILLVHSPDIVKKAARSGINLYLCGHTHGGQICLKYYGPLIINSRAPRRFGWGKWHYNDMVGYTSNGVGTASLPVRFNCPPEILVITLAARKKGSIIRKTGDHLK